MITDYNKRKDEVLAVYDKFKAMTKELEDMLKNAEIPSPLIRCKASLDAAERKANDIREDKFRLMIAGEAKAGKSTFINAYLGIEILPMDIKQCTSSIVEIVYGEEFKLEATYADNRKITLESEEDIRVFLSKKAAINDNYRDIPVAAINYDLLVRYGKKSKNIPNEDIENFIKAEEIQAANIHNIKDYDQKIRKYIASEKNNWKNIITDIKVFFPFEDEALRGIEIIDSPGVCARGGVSEITEEYIENANAIIFLKPISGQALESRQFSEFLKDKSVERNKNALFLVLTRSANVTPAELERIKEEANKQFAKMIPSSNIIAVDSKSELYANLFANIDNIGEKLTELNNEGTLDRFVPGIWFNSHNDKSEFIINLKQQSNFAQVENALSTFGRKAHYILLAEFMGLLSDIYTRIIGDVNDNTARLREKAEDPNELARKIGEIKNELEIIQEKMHIGLDKAVSKYMGEDNEIRKAAEKAAQDFKTQTEKIDPNRSDSFDELERQINYKIDEFKKLQQNLQKQMVSEFNALLIKISDEGEIPYTSLKPDFSDEVFKQLKENTKSKANETRSYETGKCVKKTHTYSEYSRSKHFKLVKNDIFDRIDTIKNDLELNLVDFVNNVSKQYLSELKTNADSKKKELDAISAAKMDAEETLKLADDLDKLLNKCNDEKHTADSIKGGIDKNVQ